MANPTINVSAVLKFTQGGQSQGLTPSANYTQVGTHANSTAQDVNTTAVAMAVGSCANVKYACVVNPADSGQTLTVTCAPQLLKPGDLALICPSTANVTLQATGAVTVPAGAVEA